MLCHANMQTLKLLNSTHELWAVYTHKKVEELLCWHGPLFCRTKLKLVLAGHWWRRKKWEFKKASFFAWCWLGGKECSLQIKFHNADCLFVSKWYTIHMCHCLYIENNKRIVMCKTWHLNYRHRRNCEEHEVSAEDRCDARPQHRWKRCEFEPPAVQEGWLRLPWLPLSRPPPPRHLSVFWRVRRVHRRCTQLLHGKRPGPLITFSFF